MGGWGTRNVCRGGEEDSERSTLTYASYASPNDASGSQAKRYEDALIVFEDDEDEGRSCWSVADGFC